MIIKQKPFHDFLKKKTQITRLYKTSKVIITLIHSAKIIDYKNSEYHSFEDSGGLHRNAVTFEIL